MDETGIFDLFNTSLIFWEIIAFALLLFLLIRYVFPPIRDQINRRQREIESSIDEAEKTRAEARELLDEARKQGDAQRERAKKEAREEGDRIIQRAKDEIGREREAAVRDVRREVAGMVILASEQVIGKKLDGDDHERLISQALDDLETEVGSTSGNGGRSV